VPSTAELTKQEINFTFLIQKPGDVVVASYNTIHWVFAPVTIIVVCCINFISLEEEILLTIGHGMITDFGW
jgi:hypothetical protein